MELLDLVDRHVSGTFTVFDMAPEIHGWTADIIFT